MNAQDDKRLDDGLDAFFAAASAEDRTMPDGLLRKVLDDAVAQQPAPRGLPVRKPALRQGWFSEIWQGFGGWRGAVALGAFLAVGVAAGYQPPSALEGVTAAITGDEPVTETAYYSLDGLMSEG
jgi:hypothetical protein